MAGIENGAVSDEDRRGVLQVVVATASREEARKIGEILLSRRLAACVQVGGPVESRFWWKGSLDEATEWLLVAKTTADVMGAVVDAVREAHSYDVPEITAVPVTGGSEAYLRWVRDEVRATPS